MKNIIIIITCFVCSIQISRAQNNSQDQLNKKWNAFWIGPSNDNGTAYGVYYFRKTIDVKEVKTHFMVHVSADNRYKLFVNGKLVSLGPARGDTFYWNYETIDLAPFLNIGKNTISALVWNEAAYRPEAQITVRTAFILQGESKEEEIANTDDSWRCIKDTGHKPIPGFFFAASKGELVVMGETVKGDWTSVNFDDEKWPNASKILEGKQKGNSDGLAWQLVPSTLPPMELKYQRILKLRKAEGMNVPAEFPSTKTSLTIPANSEVTLLLDQTFETNAYVTLSLSGGNKAGLSIGYAETLYDKGSNGRRKSNRNDIENKEFIGRIDSLVLNGSANQKFTTLNFRTFRYIQLKIKTKDEAVTLNDIYGTFTGYPFQQNAVLRTDDEEMKKIFDIGWHTARLNAWETYTDCPYYEQLQYIGDTRIQAMISYYNSGDDRLARNAINLMDHSRLTEGVTMSRYPTHSTQIISPFSLWYIGMLHDYWWYRNDENFVKNKLTGVQAILEFFNKYQDESGSVKNLPYWRFVDWAGDMGWGPNSADGTVAIYDLQLLWAYEWAGEMEAKLGLKVYADVYAKRVKQLKETIKKKYWDNNKQLFADTAEKKGFSQHANSLAILTGLVNREDLAAFANRLLTDKSLTQCTIYFQYYLNQALVKAGLGNEYMNWLDIWRENIQMGLTTWAEDSSLKTVRSDCHAWGASPNIEFFRTVLGIDSDSPGFQKIKIEPHLGGITHISGEMPHPNGKISVAYTLKNKKWKVKIHIPKKTSANFIWEGKIHYITTETTEFEFKK
ncbi:alpha-L-rhamnosidase C-terminal domain-containing protein [Zhouia sp. PK063]|uniref:alpha-L-rhamnosidase-related protein n=1 Tax=Zhouia sp. PK063 TaxID=3373602 RepID=UPI0037B9E7A7